MKSSSVQQTKRKLDAAKAKIKARHAFDFKLEGRRCCHVHERGEIVLIGIPDKCCAAISQLFREINRFEKRTKSLNLRPLDVKRYLYKYFRTKVEINKALRHVSVSVPLAD
jgi:hypothetical protein